MPACAAYTVADLAARVGGVAEGDVAARIDRVAPLEEAEPGSVSFFTNRKYLAAFEATRATV
jgi:UDP-3-O-[3-hydroxymyristoyl] glucosamine N-acyltransferase